MSADDAVTGPMAITSATPQAIGAPRRPSAKELKHILARHRGWLQQNGHLKTESYDTYLENIEPAHPGWKAEADAAAEQADLSKADLLRADLRGAHLEQANLSGANLSLTKLDGAHLENADLRGANLFDAHLSKANLNGADLTGASLSGADISFASLFGAKLGGTDLCRTNLSGAFLSNTNLRDATLLSSANLASASLNFVDLSGLKLFSVNLCGASLFKANLSGANLFKANLSGADLSGANLSAADLRNADLSGARLSGANLTESKLWDMNLANARLDFADLTKAVYDPRSEPPYPYVAGIRGLAAVQIPNGRQVGLVQLRKLLRDAGFRDLERQATYSIEHNAASKGLPGFIRKLAFGCTTAFGMRPFQALVIIVGIWLLCIPVYYWSIVDDPGRSEEGNGIYQVLPANRIAGPSGVLKTDHIEKEPKLVRVQAQSSLDAVQAAAHFSLLSAVNIGFEQFTPGDWIRRLQPHDYMLQGEGWVRIVAGLQALLSVFLLAMWALTQFGRPFQ